MADPNYFSQKRPEMLAFVPERRDRVLEVGCSEGHFLAQMPGVTERWGVEPSAAAEQARTRLDHVFQATFDGADPELPAGYFDVVVCNDVIEHMPDHDAFFERVKRVVAPGGVIVGSIPNVRFYYNLFQMVLEKDWHYQDSGILDRTHTRFFTEKSLRACLSRHGWAVQRFEGLNQNIVMYGHRAKTYHLMSKALIAGTLGYFSDIQYLQFGFRATPG